MKFILKVFVFLLATFAPVYSTAGLHWESEAQWEEMEEVEYDEDSEDIFESIQKFIIYALLFIAAIILGLGLIGLILSTIKDWFTNNF